MKVLANLGLLAASALALGAQEQPAQQKKLIGGPDSLPYFLRPGYNGPMPGEQKHKIIGGPDSLPYFLRPGYDGPMPGDEKKHKLIGGPDSLPYFLRPGYDGPMPGDEKKHKKIGGPDSLPYFLRPGYDGPMPGAEKSGLIEDVKPKAVELKNKVVEGAKKVKDALVKGAKKAQKYIKEKLSKKPAAEETRLDETAVEPKKHKKIGGPDSLPYFLRPGYNGPMPGEKKHKKIGGPDSLPYFLRPGYNGPMPGDEKKHKKIGGPDSLPYFLRPGYDGPMPGAEKSGLIDDVKPYARNAKEKIVENGKLAREAIATGAKKLSDKAKELYQALKNKINQTQ